MTTGAPPVNAESPIAPNRTWRRRIVVIAIVLLLAAIVQWHRNMGLAILGRWHHWQTGARGVDVETARDWIRNGDLLVDVRETEEFNVSRLSGAISVPVSEFLKKGLPTKPSGDQRVVVYCTIGRRSGDIARRLNDDGVSAYNLLGGILQVANAAPDWIDSGDDGPQLHVWSEDYAWLAPPEFSTTSFSVVDH